MPDVETDRVIASASVADATAAVRRQATVLASAVRRALELQAARTRAAPTELVLAVLECLKGQEAMTERVLECLSAHEAATEELSQRVSALERRLATTTLKGATPPREPRLPVTESHANGAAPAADLPDAVAAARPRRGLARLLSRGAPACAVCRREPPRRSRRELAKAGWAIVGRSSVCPGCGAVGWRLGDEGGLPFRQRATSGG
jgi:hypothetical protein